MPAIKMGRRHSIETVEIDPAAPWLGVAFRGEGRQLAVAPSRAEIDQPPVLSEPTDQVLTYTEDGPPARLMQGVVLSDLDGLNPSDSYRLSISVSGGGGRVDLRSGGEYYFFSFLSDPFVTWHLATHAYDGEDRYHLIGRVYGVNSPSLGIDAPLGVILKLLDDLVYINTSETSDPADRLVTLSLTDRDADGGPQTAQQTQILRVVTVDDPPVARNDAFLTNESTAISGNLFSNNGSGADSDADGPALSVGAVNGSAANVGTQIVLASGALLTVDAGGTFRYDPNRAFASIPPPGSGASNLTAADSFTYTLAGGSTATARITMTGVDSADLLLGTAGNDVLLGGVGIDVLAGGLGDDTYYVQHSADVVIEAPGGGNDRVAALASYALGAGSAVEILEAITLSETTPLDLAGNELVNLVIGNAGANSLSGGGGDDVLIALGGDDQLFGDGGADRMYGGTGDDTYYVGEAGDSVIETAGQGADLVLTTTSYTLAAGSEIERLEALLYYENTPMTLTGNEFANVVIGNYGGMNWIDGRGGNDILTGGSRADNFVFSTALGAGNVDVIQGYHFSFDRIRLDDAVFVGLAPGALAAGAFAVGTAAADADDRIIYDGVSGALYFDADGNGAGAAIQFATLNGAPPYVSANDFYVI
jgi:Ca2+-binding RTX toxin-like protein